MLPAVWHPAANLGVVGLERVQGGLATPTGDRERMAAKPPQISASRAECRSSFAEANSSLYPAVPLRS